MPSELARFLPRIARASEESLPSIGEKPQEYEAVVAFLDIQSSVTISLALERSSEDSSSKVSRALQERTRPGNGEAIRKALNTFFESSISIIEMYGGDVLKFAGDAMIVAFPLIPEETTLAGGPGLRAVHASLRIQQELDGFDIGLREYSFHYKIALASGKFWLLHLGTVDSQKELVEAGPAVTELQAIGSSVSAGEVRLSPSVYELVKAQVRCRPQNDGNYIAEEITAKWPIAKRIETSEKVEESEKLLCPYVPTPYLYRYSRRGEFGLLRELQEAEIRKCAVVFVMVNPEAKIDDHCGDALMNIHQRAFQTLQQCTKEQGGGVRQYLLDDKGYATFVGAWGMPTQTHADDRPRATCAALNMNAMMRQNGMKTKIGIAYGSCFVGTVGSTTRVEYSISGTIVNLAARLMTANEENGVLCDSKTAQGCPDSTVEFVKKIQAKGFEELIDAYQPIACSRGNGGELDRMAVTPTELERVTPEIRQVKESINEVSSENRSRFVYFSCSRGAWERDAQLYALQCAKEKGMERICEQPDKAQYRVCSGFRQTLRDLLPVNDGSKDGIMRAVMETSEELDEAIEQGLIPRAHEMNKHLQAVLYEGHNHACEHLHLTPDVLHFLYDLNVGEATCTRSFSKSTKLQVVAEGFLASLIQMRALRRKPIAIAISSAGSLDQLSWLVVSALARRPNNRLFLCLSGDLDQLQIASKMHLQAGDSQAEFSPLKCIKLGQLDEEQLEVLLKGVLNVSSVDSFMVKAICEKTNGSYDLALQSVHWLQTGEGIQVEGDHAALSKSMADAFLSEAISNLILSSMDALDTDADTIAKLASIFGLRFKAAEVSCLASSSGWWNNRSNVADHLEELRKSGILFKGEQVGKEEFSFDLPVRHQAVYDSIPNSAKRKLHSQAVNVLHTLYQDYLKDGDQLEFFEKVAQHASRGEDMLGMASEAFLHALKLAFEDGMYEHVLQMSEFHDQVLERWNGSVYTLIDRRALTLLYRSEALSRGSGAFDHACLIAEKAFQVARDAASQKPSQPLRCFPPMFSPQITSDLLERFAEAALKVFKYSLFSGRSKEHSPLRIADETARKAKRLRLPRAKKRVLLQVTAVVFYFYSGPQRAKEVHANILSPSTADNSNNGVPQDWQTVRLYALAAVSFGQGHYNEMASLAHSAASNCGSDKPLLAACQGLYRWNWWNRGHQESVRQSIRDAQERLRWQSSASLDHVQLLELACCAFTSSQTAFLLKRLGGFLGSEGSMDHIRQWKSGDSCVLDPSLCNAFAGYALAWQGQWSSALEKACLSVGALESKGALLVMEVIAVNICAIVLSTCSLRALRHGECGSEEPSALRGVLDRLGRTVDTHAPSIDFLSDVSALVKVAQSLHASDIDQARKLMEGVTSKRPSTYSEGYQQRQVAFLYAAHLRELYGESSESLAKESTELLRRMLNWEGTEMFESSVEVMVARAMVEDCNPSACFLSCDSGIESLLPD